MKTINLDKFRKARLWINELPDATYIPAGMFTHSVSVRNRGTIQMQVGAIELFVPLGARSMYGLVGGCFEPIEGDSLSVEIYISSSTGRVLPENLAGSNDEVRVGLPAEYVRGIVAGIDAACSRLSGVATGKLRINCAAHGLIGSSEAIYTEVAAALVRFFHCADENTSDLDLINLF
ncbi:hypothetical protein [Burkholderia ubonensis]|uniref:hypothetical protein n=1 Tax=Burkholderia ubonensis TaxID=101571 RepID=UPI0012FA6E52|nr:hypothetical protein [Burkholderia ubonensis]